MVHTIVVSNCVVPIVETEYIGVVAIAAMERIVTSAAIENVIAVAAVERVVAFIAVKRIISGVAIQEIISHATVQRIISGVAVQCVISFVTVHSRSTGRSCVEGRQGFIFCGSDDMHERTACIIQRNHARRIEFNRKLAIYFIIAIFNYLQCLPSLLIDNDNIIVPRNSNRQIFRLDAVRKLQVVHTIVV